MHRGRSVPIFEIRETAGMTDMLIRDAKPGHALAVSIADKPAVLMRAHGATIVAPSLQRVIGRSIFLALNATLRMQAMMMVQGGSLIEARTPKARI